MEKKGWSRKKKCITNFVYNDYIKIHSSSSTSSTSESTTSSLILGKRQSTML